MKPPLPTRLPDAAAVAEVLRRHAPEAGCDAEVRGADGPLGEPLTALGRTLDNRFCVHPMEGWDGTPDGGPTELTLRRWRAFGRSGAALVWGGEAVAVARDGRANPNQLCLEGRADPLADLRALLGAVRAGQAEAGLDPGATLVGLQLTHSGRFSRPLGPPAPRLAARVPWLDARVGAGPDVPLVTDDELEGLVEAYLRAGELARAAGFDFVDVKACHGYLVHELLAARTRPGPFGGDLAGRARFLLTVVERLRERLPDLGVGVRATLGDGVAHRPDPEPGPHHGVGQPDPAARDDAAFRFGGDPRDHDPARADDPADPLHEPLELLRLLRARGVTLFNVSLGSPYWCPHLQRPAAYPPSDGYLPPEDPLDGVAAHLVAARAARRALPDGVVVGSGYSYLMEWLPGVAQHEVRTGGVDAVGLGRGMLSYPELCADVLAGRPLDRRRLCRTFSDCTTAPRQGLVSGCYPLDPLYRARPEAALLRELKRSRHARG